MLTAVACTGDLTCGFSTDQDGYRCLRPEDDACAGVSDLGACEHEVARICHAGEVVASSCAACGARCAWDASAGRHACL
jgi:hypothetical protein